MRLASLVPYGRQAQGPYRAEGVEDTRFVLDGRSDSTIGMITAAGTWLAGPGTGTSRYLLFVPHALRSGL
jgi:hypothetical protein